MTFVATATADLFQTSKPRVAGLLKSIVAEAGLDPVSVVNPWLTRAADAKNDRLTCYNLDAILAVGDRCSPARHGMPGLACAAGGQGLHHGEVAAMWIGFALLALPSFLEAS
jgi:hypothetical protein